MTVKKDEIAAQINKLPDNLLFRFNKTKLAALNTNENPVAING